MFGSLQFGFGSIFYISMSVHVKFEVEHSTTFGSSYAPGLFYQVSKLTVSIFPHWYEHP